MAAADSGGEERMLVRLRLLRRALVRARALLSVPQRWTRGELARDGRGRAVLPGDGRAARWCLAGALLRAGAEVDRERLCPLSGGAPESLGADDLAASPTGLLGLLVAGAVIAARLARVGGGRRSADGRSFEFAAGSEEPSRVELSKLPEITNDAVDYRWIRCFLRLLERDVQATIEQLEAGTSPPPGAGGGGG